MYSVEGKKKYLLENKDGRWSIDGVDFEGRILAHPSGTYAINLNNKTFYAEIESISEDKKELLIRVGHNLYPVRILDRMQKLMEELGMSEGKGSAADVIRAPMPGLIVDVCVSPGDTVSDGDSLLVLEAMKMENNIKATHEAKITEVLVEKGQSVEKNQVLIKF